MTKQVKRRKASIYLVRYDIGSCLDDGKPLYSFEVFGNKKEALRYAQDNGGVVTSWLYHEQIEVPKRRGNA